MNLATNLPDPEAPKPGWMIHSHLDAQSMSHYGGFPCSVADPIVVDG